ncbi:MAG: hypothetical protein JWM76_1904, partial [Pseudonocardiales bacterium]|nr:hypothetical protein [Pseudonocardiales bacterium]
SAGAEQIEARGMQAFLDHTAQAPVPPGF